MAWDPKKKVIVPFDFSDESIEALDTALSLATGPSSVHLVHVLPELSLGEAGVIWDEIKNENRIEHAREAIVAKLSDPKYAELKIDVEIGDPGHRIADVAKKLSADLIVMPSHGRTGIAHMLIGSVAERVLRLAHCPVLVLRGK
jgi:nucleotide-binding universal stress UspA family protein